MTTRLQDERSPHPCLSPRRRGGDWIYYLIFVKSFFLDLYKIDKMDMYFWAYFLINCYLGIILNKYVYLCMRYGKYTILSILNVVENGV
jgi:hypothetical protein